ncbi:MAG: NUDIX domain-containing protein [Acidimicrobiales bacterium]
MQPRQRSVRGVVLAPGHRVLLQQGHDPTDLRVPPYWFLPGGRLQPGEDAVAALHRELLEECGLLGLEIGPVLWRQRSRFRFAGLDFDQDEQIHLIRVAAAGEIVPTALDPLEAAAFGPARWWPLGEVAATPDVVYPLDLVERLRAAGLLAPP